MFAPRTARNGPTSPSVIHDYDGDGRLTITDTAPQKTTNVSRAELTRVSTSTFALIALAAMVIGVAVGGLTSNTSFLYLMCGLPLVAIFAYAIAEPNTTPTRPARGENGSALPIVSLVLACTGTSVIAIALGHASRHLISTKGGEGERIALAALIIGYATLSIQASVVFWIITYIAQLPK